MISKGLAITIAVVIIIGLGAWAEKLSPGSKPQPNFSTYYPGGE